MNVSSLSSLKSLSWLFVGLGVAVSACTVKVKDDEEPGSAGSGNSEAGSSARAGESGVAGEPAAAGSGSGKAGSSSVGEGGSGGTETGSGGTDTGIGGVDATAGTAGAADKSGGPIGVGLADGGEDGTGGTTSTDGETDGPGIDDGSRAAARAIQEADIIQVKGDRLYAMSTAGGLSVIDVSVRDELKLLGRYRTDAAPFEMFVRGETIFGLFNDACAWDGSDPVGEKARVVALNVADPANITEIATFDVPGKITDSRVVGDIMYVVGYRDGMCYDCGTQPLTTVISLNISVPADVALMDSEEFEDVSGDADATQNTVMVTDQRIYVSSVQDAMEQSTIQVVDISDSGGQMEVAGTVDVEGAIFNRWQMDEYMGVLRVISQPPDWNMELPPVVQTFTINDSYDIEKLGRLDLVNVPEREQLRSVRFDADRAFAVTFLNTDPMYTIDLSDPANPAQTGELTMDGFLYHMEPRGDRMLALGFDNTNSEGGLNVSLIDIADLSDPKLLERVNFGGTWSTPTLSEGQDRVHKLFNILDDLGMILVPYSGWAGSEYGCGSYQSAIQLLTYSTKDDTLALEGVAPSVGTARRAFLNDERLFSVSTDRVQVFNIDDLKKPVETAAIGLASRVHRTVVVGDKVLRIQSSYDTHVATADLVNLAGADMPSLDQPLNLVEALYDDADTSSCYYYDDGAISKAPAFVFGEHVALVVTHYDSSTYAQVTDVLVIDCSGDTPTVSKRVRVDGVSGTPDLGQSAVQVGNLLVLQTGTTPGYDETSEITPKIEAIDFSDPENPDTLSSLTRETAWGSTGLFAKGDQTASGYYTQDDDNNVSYLLDRVDWTTTSGDAQDDYALPGLLLGPLGEDYLTVDFQWASDDSTDYYTCQQNGGEYDDDTSSCWVSDRTIQLVDVSGTKAEVLSTSSAMDRDLRIAAVHASDTRYFLPSVSYDSTTGTTRERVAVVGADNTNQVELRIVALARAPMSPVAVGEKLYFINGPALGVIDASNLGAPKYSRLATLPTENGVHLSITGNTALVSMGDAGVQVISLE
jgi:hypothetical protein